LTFHHETERERERETAMKNRFQPAMLDFFRATTGVSKAFHAHHMPCPNCCQRNVSERNVGQSPELIHDDFAGNPRPELRSCEAKDLYEPTNQQGERGERNFLS